MLCYGPVRSGLRLWPKNKYWLLHIKRERKPALRTVFFVHFSTRRTALAMQYSAIARCSLDSVSGLNHAIRDSRDSDLRAWPGPATAHCQHCQHCQHWTAHCQHHVPQCLGGRQGARSKTDAHPLTSAASYRHRHRISKAPDTALNAGVCSSRSASACMRLTDGRCS